MSKIGTTVVLNEVEQRLCKHVAERRYNTSRQKGVPDAKVSSQSNAEVDLEGVAAELAFCKIFNAYPQGQFDISVKSAKYGTDDKGDVVINGVRVDVKSTKYLNGKLIAAKWKNPNNVDAFALMVGEFPEYKYCGAIPANELLKDERLKNLKHGDTYVAVQEELVDSLWEEASV